MNPTTKEIQIYKSFEEVKNLILVELESLTQPVKRYIIEYSPKRKRKAEEEFKTPEQSLKKLTSRMGKYTREIYHEHVEQGADAKEIAIELVREGNPNETNDEEFIWSDNIGKLGEIYVSLNMKCPICKSKSFKLFENPNMPIVDLYCTNTSHNISEGPKLWQVKTSQGEGYFSKKENFITVGSRNFGNVIHEDGVDQSFRIGYICLDVVKKEETEKINLTDSFMLYAPNNKYFYYEGFEKEEKDRFRSSLYKKEPMIGWIGDALELREFLDSPIKEFDRSDLLSYKQEKIPTIIDENNQDDSQRSTLDSSNESLLGGSENFDDLVKIIINNLKNL